MKLLWLNSGLLLPLDKGKVKTLAVLGPLLPHVVSQLLRSAGSGNR